MLLVRGQHCNCYSWKWNLCRNRKALMWKHRGLELSSSTITSQGQRRLRELRDTLKTCKGMITRGNLPFVLYIYIIFTNFKPLFMHFDVLFASRWWKHYVILLFVSRRNDWRFEKHMISHLRVCIMVLFFFLKIYLWWCVEIMWRDSYSDYYINNPQIKKLKITHMYRDIYM